ncbi:MAG: 50S ribosomal protein L32 [Firmicutes bacterium]|nr:50S ribosomal protein L32 [Bacillota bacterium]
MANPKYKTSRSKTRRRRANLKVEIPNVIECPSCKAPTLPHRICTSCGTYKGRQVFKLEKEAAK